MSSWSRFHDCPTSHCSRHEMPLGKSLVSNRFFKTRTASRNFWTCTTWGSTYPLMSSRRRRYARLVNSEKKIHVWKLILACLFESWIFRNVHRVFQILCNIMEDLETALLKIVNWSNTNIICKINPLLITNLETGWWKRSKECHDSNMWHILLHVITGNKIKAGIALMFLILFAMLKF